MPAVSCPSCNETVRLPAARLPDDASIECPWCRDLLPVEAWQAKLPPKAVVRDAEGREIDFSALELVPVEVVPCDTERQDAERQDTERQDTERQDAERQDAERHVTDEHMVLPETSGDLSGDDRMGLVDQHLVTAPELLIDGPALIEDGVTDEASVEARFDSIENEHPPGEVKTPDDTIDLDQDPPAASGISRISMEEDEFPSELISEQPTIEEIEDAWDSPEQWESQVGIENESSFVGDFNDEDEFEDDEDFADELASDHCLDRAESDQPEPKVFSQSKIKNDKVPFADDQRSYYQRHKWGRKPRHVFRTLKIAAPTLVAFPIIGVILYLSGIDLGFYPFNPTSGQQVADQSSQQPFGGEPGQGKAAAANSVHGGVTAQPSEQTTQPAEQTAEPAEQTAEPAEQTAESAEQGSKFDSVDEMIQSLNGITGSLAGDSDSADSDSGADQPRRITAAQRAREQWVQRNPAPEVSAFDRETARLNSVTLAFPRQAPDATAIESVDSAATEQPSRADMAIDAGQPDDAVQQASAQSEIKSTEIAPAEIAPAEIAPPPARIDQADEKNTEPAPATPWLPAQVLDLSKDEPAVEADSPELVEACEQAGASISKLPPAVVSNTDGARISPRGAMVARLIAFRDISRLGQFPVGIESPSIAAILEEVLRPDTLQQLEPLCGEWVGWGRRKTDGMLLIGTLRQESDDQFVVLADGTRFRVLIPDHLELPFNSECVALGKIISTDEVPLVQLVAGVVVP